MSLDGMTESERRLRTLVDWLRHPEWAPRGADVCADDIEALLSARSPAPDVSRLLAAAKEARRLLREGVVDLGEVVLVLNAAIAEHEAAAGGGTSVETCTNVQQAP